MVPTWLGTLVPSLGLLLSTQQARTTSGYCEIAPCVSAWFCVHALHGHSVFPLTLGAVTGLTVVGVPMALPPHPALCMCIRCAEHVVVIAPGGVGGLFGLQGSAAICSTLGGIQVPSPAAARCRVLHCWLRLPALSMGIAVRVQPVDGLLASHTASLYVLR